MVAVTSKTGRRVVARVRADVLRRCAGLLSVLVLVGGVQLVHQTPAAAATATTMQLASSLSGPTTAVVGQKITLTATVQAGAAIPTGTVVFTDGATTLGSTTLYFGRYLFTVASLSAGNHTITATYGGGSSYAPSAAALTIKVVTASTGTSLVAGGPTVAGQPLTLTANVTALAPSTGAPVGTVTFLDGTTPIGSAGLFFNKYTLVTSSLRAGSHRITARFGSTAAYLTSTSAAVTVVVDPILWPPPPGPNQYGYWPQTVAPFDGTGRTIGLLGDSITYYDAPSFRAQAADAGFAASVTGIPGYQLAGVKPWLDLYADATPDVMVLNLGTNDASGDAKGYPNFSLDLYRQRLGLAAALFPQSCVVVTTLTTHRTPARTSVAKDGYTAAAWNAVTASYNQHLRATFDHVADWDALLAIHPEYAPDEVHPLGSADGVAALARLQLDAARSCA